MRIFASRKNVYSLLSAVLIILLWIYLFVISQESGKALQEANNTLQECLYRWSSEQSAFITYGFRSEVYSDRRLATDSGLEILSDLPILELLKQWDPDFGSALSRIQDSNERIRTWHASQDRGLETYPHAAAESMTSGINDLTVLYGFFLNQQAQFNLNLIIFLVAGLLFSAFLIIYLERRNRLRLSTEQRAHNLSRYLISDYEKRMHSIALDLHDDVAQELCLLRLEQDLSRKEQLLDSAISRLRCISYEIRPGKAAAMPLAQGIRSLASEFAGTGSWRIDFQESGLNGVKLPFEFRNHVYRMVQEALNNIRKHALADSVSIKVACAYPDLIVSIEDDGCGFSISSEAGESEPQGLGLQGMRERVEILGGEFSIESAAGKGTRLRFILSLKDYISG